MQFKPTRRMLRQLELDNKKWPEQLKPIPIEDWPAEPWRGPDAPVRTGLFRSRRFLVQVFAEDEGVTRLSINRTDWSADTGKALDGITWDQMQKLKAEAGFADAWAVEIFPAEDEIINVAPMRHLWVLPRAPEFAWRGKR